MIYGATEIATEKGRLDPMQKLARYLLARRGFKGAVIDTRRADAISSEGTWARDVHSRTVVASTEKLVRDNTPAVIRGGPPCCGAFASCLRTLPLTAHFLDFCVLLLRFYSATRLWPCFSVLLRSLHCCLPVAIILPFAPSCGPCPLYFIYSSFFS